MNLEGACDRVAMPARNFLVRKLGDPVPVGDTLQES